jgi:hypothetical protein
MLKLAAVTLAALLSTLSMACGGDSGAPGEDGDTAPVPGTTTPASAAACKLGDTRACKRDIGEYNGIVLCFSGEQVCGDHGDWGDCKEKTDH